MIKVMKKFDKTGQYKYLVIENEISLSRFKAKKGDLLTKEELKLKLEVRECYYREP